MTALALTVLLFFSTYACFVFVHDRIGAYDRAVGGHTDMLDVLRGLCANGVFCAHLVKTYALFELGSSKQYDASLHAADYLGDLGVAVFFLITGYLFMGPAFPRSTTWAGSRTFLSRRMLRLGPAFFAIAAFAFIFHVVYLRATGMPHGFTDYARAFVRLFSFGFLYPPIGDDRFLEHSSGMAWSLSFEWIFYVLVGMAALAGRKMALPAACLLVGAAGWLALGRVVFFAYMAFFCFGGAVFWAFHGPRRGARLAAILAAGVVFGVLTDRWWQLVPGLVLVTAFLGVARVPAMLRPFAEAGKVTYSYYLFHGSVLLAVYAASRSFLKPDTLYTPDLFVFGLLAAAGCALVASYSFRFFELPYFQRKRQAPARQAS